VLLLSMLSMVAHALAAMSGEMKPTQAQLDKLDARVEEGLKTIDERLAKRLAKLFDQSALMYIA
jgi:hypothetical protein